METEQAPNPYVSNIFSTSFSLFLVGFIGGSVKRILCCEGSICWRGGGGTVEIEGWGGEIGGELGRWGGEIGGLGRKIEVQTVKGRRLKVIK